MARFLGCLQLKVSNLSSDSCSSNRAIVATNKHKISRTWDDPNVRKKRSQSEQATLGALGCAKLNSLNDISRLAKTTTAGGVNPRVDGKPYERSSFLPDFPERFSKIGAVGSELESHHLSLVLCHGVKHKPV